MKKMRKLAALLLAVMMTVGLCATAWASSAELMADHNGKDTSIEIARVLKEILAYNPENSTVNEPTATYTYTISAGTAGQLVTDKNSVQALTKAGIMTNVKMTSQTSTDVGNNPLVTTLTYDPDYTTTFTATNGGTSNTKYFDIDFSDVVFGAAGIYRYTITESGYTYTSNGVIEADTGHTRYLDVYVKQNGSFTEGTTAAEWDVYGYALFTTDNTPIVDDALEGGNEATPLYKTTGFVSDELNEKTADAYYTFNVTVKKNLVKDFAQNSNKFPFKVDFENDTVTADVLPIVSYTGTVTVPTLTKDAISDLDVDGTSTTATNQIKIAHNGTVKFTGIPAGTTITIDEYNNVTGTFYTVTTSGGDTNEQTGVKVAWDTWAGNTAKWTETTAVQEAKEFGEDMTKDTNKTVIFRNELAEISPTGVVLRVAPYVLMLAAGLMLLMLSRRRRTALDD